MAETTANVAVFCWTLMFWVNEGTVLVSLLYHYYTIMLQFQFNDEYDLGGILSVDCKDTRQYNTIQHTFVASESEARRWN